MTDDQFELRIQRVLRADAERAVRTFDPVELALEAAGAPARRDPLAWRPAGWPIIRLVLVASLLLAAALATLWLVGGAPRRPVVLDAGPSPSTGPLAPGPLPASLSGPWLAEKPASLSLGTSSVVPRMSLFVDSGGAAVFVTSADELTERLRSLAEVEGQDIVRFTSPAPTGPVVSSGATLRGCTTGEVGSYRLRTSPDGLRLTLDVVDDLCPSRALVFARTWTRSLGLPNSGGIGVVDAFEPLFTVELPAGGYTTDRTADHLTIVQAVPEFQFLAWKDPQGWIDPCDPGQGRYPIEPGADAFVAYARQMQGFTGDSTSELEVDGHRAVRLVIHTNPDVACQEPVQWQTKAETGSRTWFLRPGDSDSLVVVELDDTTTVMFSVLPAPHALESQVMGSIRFLDQLPEAP